MSKKNSNSSPEAFIEIPALATSICQRKKLYGVGINDSSYSVHHTDKLGLRTRCPYYVRWAGMLRRCYSPKFHKKQPSYIGCTVAKEWLYFTVFKSWMIKQDWKCKELDKDLLFKHNSVYSPSTTVFISAYINTFLYDSIKPRGKYGQGVYKENKYGRFIAECRNKHLPAGRVYLGSFSNPEEANQAYVKYKIFVINQAASLESNNIITQALLNRAHILGVK